jgi:NTE family protein
LLRVAAENRKTSVQPKAGSIWTSVGGLLSAADIWSPTKVTPPESLAEIAEIPGTTVLEVEASQAADLQAGNLQAENLEVENPEVEAAAYRTPALTNAWDTTSEPTAPVAPTPAAAADTAPRTSVERRAAQGNVDRAASLTNSMTNSVRPRAWPPRKLSLALQGGGSFGAYSWGVLERLLEEPDCEFDAISGTSGGAVNAALVACGLIVDGREGARKLLARFWNRVINEASFRSLMLIGGFSPVGSSVAFGQTLTSGRFDPFDLDPLRRALQKDIDFDALRASVCPKLLVAATRIRDGRQQIFRNRDITADTLLASTCPPLVHCAVEIDGESYWDGGFSGNPPVVSLVQDSEATDVLVVQVTPAHDNYVPITSAAIDRRLDQINANAALNAEITALEWATRDHAAATHPATYPATYPLRIFRLAAEDEIEGLAQRSAVDLGRSFITQLHRAGYTAADRWLRQTPNQPPSAIDEPLKKPTAFWVAPSFVDAAV